MEGLTLVDSDVFIASFRGKETARKDLAKLHGKIAISVITALELMRGARTETRKEELSQQLKAYSIIQIDTATSVKAMELMNKYISGRQDVFIADCFIAATAVVHNIPLFTYNHKDFNYIKEVKFFNA